MAFKSALLAAILILNVSSIAAQQPAPDFVGQNMLTGQSVRLADYRGKVVFIDFWASWCPPCLVSLPAYDQMRSQIGTDQFEIIAVNVDENPSDGLQFLYDNPVSYPVVSDPEGAIGIPYRVRSLPVSFLLDQQGRIIETFRGFKSGDERDIEIAIQSLLKQ